VKSGGGGGGVGVGGSVSTFDISHTLLYYRKYDYKDVSWV
jgi:hypothetical protein